MLFHFFSSNSQTVESKTYQVMLKGLLSHTVQEVSVNDIEKEEDILFVDSREKKEFEVSHIKNAVWVGYDRLNLKPLKKIDKNKKIVVYCSVGYRSEKVAEKLKKMGFTDVSNLYGGIFEWKNQEREVFDSEEELTERVHAFNKVWGIWLRKGEKIY